MYSPRKTKIRSARQKIVQWVSFGLKKLFKQFKQKIPDVLASHDKKNSFDRKIFNYHLKMNLVHLLIYLFKVLEPY